MIRVDDLDFAIERTIEVHPDFLPMMSGILLSQITKGVYLQNFTSNGGARERILKMEVDDVIRYVLHESIKIYNAATYFYYNDPKICSLPNDSEKIKYLLEVFPAFGELQNMMGVIAGKDINISLHLKSNTNDLTCLVNAVVDTRFKTGVPYRDYIDRFGNGNTITPQGENVNLFSKVNEDIDKAKIAQEVRVNYRAVNKCMGDLMSGVQLKNKRNEYALEGNLFASSDVGNVRRNQEDVTVILTHPSNPEFKFLAVSDGMGGVEYGDKASMYMLQQITVWFNNLNPDFFYYPNELREAFNQKIVQISNEIYQTYNADYNRVVSGATFVGAIVTNNDTIVSTVGDSRAYYTRGSELGLLTRDESFVWVPTKGAEDITAEELDELRFHRRNNQITRCVGMEGLNSVQSRTIPNASYDRLMLFSDGVTDLLSTDRIKFIALNTPPEQLTNQFVNEAILYNAVRAKGEDNEHYAAVQAGKDNATVAAYIRR